MTVKVLELVSVIASLLTLIIAGLTVIRRLALIQKRLNSLKGLIVIGLGRTTDIEGFLIAKHGYHARIVNSEIEQTFSLQYEDEDTGF
ncbi:hypothetical protein [Microcoleus sp.]|uniref:hypothetical protein n=1 Tax=Microcoleus sp. TaxID=44472 RepID=UPI003524108B